MSSSVIRRARRLGEEERIGHFEGFFVPRRNGMEMDSSSALLPSKSKERDCDYNYITYRWRLEGFYFLFIYFPSSLTLSVPVALMCAGWA